MGGRDKYRYDLLGRAMQAAGIDSGMKQSGTLTSGLQGALEEASTDYSNITSSGLMAYRVRYGLRCIHRLIEIFNSQFC